MGSKKDETKGKSKKSKDKKKHKSSDKKKSGKKSKEGKRSSKHDKIKKLKGISAKRSSSSSSSTSSSDERGGSEVGPQLPTNVDIGPQLPPSTIGLDTSIVPDIGPQLPPGIVLPSSESEDLIGPQIPQAKQDDDDQPGPQLPPPSRPMKLGPSVPAGVDLDKLAAMRDKVDWQQLAVEEEEDEEDTIGPAMPGQETIGYLRATAAAEARAYNEMMSQMEAEEQAKVPKHEEWMTALPEHRDLSFTVEQMQQNRTFGRREKETVRDGSAWTDTPADRERKARERRLGLKRGADEAAAAAAERPRVRPPAESAATASASAVISQYNAALRPKSLVEQHREAQAKAGRGPGAKALEPGGWDRSSISQTREMGHKAADKVFKEAQTLDSRFGSRQFHGL